MVVMNFNPKHRVGETGAPIYGKPVIIVVPADETIDALLEETMTDLTEEKIQQSIEDRKRTHRRFLENVKTYKPFLELEEKAFKGGALSRKHKELMALSISIVTKCEPCMEWHLDQALQYGATDEEIYETIDVSIEMGGGPAGAYARFVLKAMDYFKANNAGGSR